MEDYKWFFEEPKNVEALKASLDSWLGTPYKHLKGVKGQYGGVDCIHMVVAAYKECGADKGRHVHIPRYRPDWHMHTGESLIIAGITKQYKVEEIKDYHDVMNGDLVLFKWGKHAAHSGIYYEGVVYQALSGIGVETRAFMGDIMFFDRLDTILRIKI